MPRFERQYRRNVRAGGCVWGVCCMSCVCVWVLPASRAHTRTLLSHSFPLVCFSGVCGNLFSNGGSLCVNGVRAYVRHFNIKGDYTYFESQ